MRDHSLDPTDVTPVLAPVDPASACETLTECLALRVRERPGALAYRYLEEGEVTGPVTSWTWGAVDERSGRVSAALGRRVPPGDRAILLFPPGLDFVAAFFGCLRAGVIAVPVPPPDPSRLEATLPRLLGIVRDAQASCVVTIASIARHASAIGGDVASLPWISVDELDDGEVPSTNATPADVAFLQYTSGSTGEPKGVRVTHANLMANLRMIGRGFALDVAGRIGQGVSWLPFYHDMGLIGCVLGPAYLGGATTLLSPLDFLKRPARWLEAISHYGVPAMSGAPDFAYAFTARRTTSATRKRLDLSRWERAFCGAEPVRSETLKLFAETFAECGFARDAFSPAYGLAEATLLVSARRPDKSPRVLDVDAKLLEQGRVGPGERPVVSCGAPNGEGRVRIVAPGATDPLPENVVGEIVVAGPHVADGYWGRPTDPAFGVVLTGGDGPYLRTGDLGFLHEGELFVSGRLKDLIVVRGRNIHPADLEAAAEAAHPALRTGGVAAFGISRDGEEKVAMICEVAPTRAVAAEVAAAVRDAVGKAHGVEVDTVLLAPPRSILRTSSGKIRRGDCRGLWQRGELALVAEERLAGPPPPPPPANPSASRAAELLAWMEAWIQARVRPGPVRSNESFTSLGLDSLNLVWLAGDLESLLGFEVPVQSLHGGTPKTTAALLAMGQLRLAPGKPRDLEGDAVLDAVIVPRAARASDRDGASFVTGATGFLGTRIVHALLRRTDRPVLCLVRASSDAAALERLRAALSAVGDFDPARVAAVAGDLSRPFFGLSPERITEVAEAVAAVYHVGAEIDWTKPYSSLRDTNVGGTREAIRLACAAGASMHHVSTVGVFPLAEDAHLPFPEDRDLTDGDRLSLGYSQSKWVAERMLEHARARGLEASVYRPSFISGDSTTGAEADSEHQLFFAFLASCVRTGEAPAVEKVIDAVPVDWVAEAIVALSLDPRARGKRFNLKNPSPLRQRRLYELVRERGWPLREVAYPRWRDQVLSLRKDDPLARFAIFYRLMDEKRMARLEAQMAESLPVDDTQARSLLDAVGVRCPPIDSRLLGTYFSYYVRRGLLPLPDALAPSAASAAAEGPGASLRALSLPPLLEPREPKLWALYGRNKAKQWDAATRIDWSTDLDPENPVDLPDTALPLYGSDVLRRMTTREQGAVRRHYQAWQLSQFMFGEQLALLGAAQLIERAPTIEAQMYAATQAGDEARHLEIYTRLIDEKFGLSYPLVEPLRRLAEQISSDNRWDMKSLGIQVLIEGLALGNFAALRDQSRNPLIASVHAYVVEDEARHVAFGRRLLAPYYAELTDGERAEREEFVVEASYLLRDRMLATEAVWEALGLPVDECQRWIRESGYQRAWASTLFSRIVPTIRAVGLWGVKVQQAYSKMGVLGYGDSSLDELTAQDELRSAVVEASHAS